MKKFLIHTMGCKSNQFESAVIEENMISHGFEAVNNAEDADFYILNSCTVTHKSDTEALYLLRSIKHKNPNILTVLTGCLAQIEKDELLKNDFVDYVVGNNEKFRLYEYINTGSRYCADDIMKVEKFNAEALENTSKTRASLKIQDGCDNRCSYCIIPYARGKSRSADLKFITEQINNFAKNGFKEVVLTGIHIGQWGKDLDKHFTDLLNAVETTDIHRYRLGSLNPFEITDEVLNILSGSKKFCPHFHLSLQSACDKTLYSMNRFYKTEDYLKQIEKINNMFDLPFIGSDIITGFAGETDEDFEITARNLRRSGLTQIHTFPYSLRRGTKGAELKEQVDDKIKEQRALIVKEISVQKYNEFVRKNLGQIREVLTEKHLDKKTGKLKGVTDNYLTVLLDSENPALTNTLKQVKITKFENNKIYGEILSVAELSK